MCRIRLADARDLNEIVDLVNRAYLVEAHFVRGPRIHRDDVARRIDDREMLYLRDVQGPLAAAHVRVVGPDGHLSLVSVAPNRQGQGHGSRMVRHAEDLAAARGALRMRLQVVNRREELPDFYKRLGYRELGTSPFDDTKSMLAPVHFIDMARELVKEEVPT